MTGIFEMIFLLSLASASASWKAPEKEDELCHLRDVQAYNRVAAAIMTEVGIAINDLHDAIQNDDVGACIGRDGVHMTERGNKVLADAVCRFILRESPDCQHAL